MINLIKYLKWNANNIQTILEEIRNSPTSVPNQDEENCTCPVCLENIADTVLLPCHHRLCTQCLLDWRGRTARSKQAGRIYSSIRF